jgi:hypothetical protein
MVDPATLDAIDPTFIPDLRRSNAPVEAVARWFTGNGYAVQLPPRYERPDPSQRGEYADGGDLWIMQRVEVKQRPSIPFTGPHDFPYQTVIVDVCHSFDRARTKPFLYTIVNAGMTHALVVDVQRTVPHWTRIERMDKGRRREFYECPIDLLSAVEIAPNVV